MPSVIATLQALFVQQQATIAEQRATIVRLKGRVRDLETWVGQHPGNSSRPPSSDLPGTPDRAVVSAADALLWCNECESDEYVVRASGMAASRTQYGTTGNFEDGDPTMRTPGMSPHRNLTGILAGGSHSDDENNTASSFALKANTLETIALKLRIDAVRLGPPSGIHPIPPSPLRWWLWWL